MKTARDWLKKDNRLGAGRAFLILLGFLGGQVLGALWAGIIGGIVAVIRGLDLQNAEAVAGLTKMITAPAITAGFIAGGIAMIVLSSHLARDQLRDESPNGAAWRMGTPGQLAGGILVGGLVAFSYLLLFSLAFPFSPAGREIGPLAKMATTPGITRVLWLLLMILLAPPIEELLFRGVLLGGFRRSFGPVGGGIAVTALFIILHVTEAVHYWPALIGISSLAGATLWIRLRTGAVGPAIAAHFSYNTLIAITVIKFSLR